MGYCLGGRGSSAEAKKRYDQGTMQLRSGQSGWRKDQASRTNSESGDTIHAAKEIVEEANDGTTRELQLLFMS